MERPPWCGRVTLHVLDSHVQLVAVIWTVQILDLPGTSLIISRGLWKCTLRREKDGILGRKLGRMVRNHC